MDKRNLIQYAQVVERISDSIPNFNPFKCGWVPVGVLDDEKTRTQAVILERPGELAIFFPCTTELADAQRDAAAGMRETWIAPGKGHEGCVEAVQSIFPALTAFLMKSKQLDSALTPITVVGYSLGGGLAILTALAVKGFYPNRDIICVTFGALRVMNGTMAVYFNSRIKESVQCVYQDDVVTHLPPWGTRPSGDLRLTPAGYYTNPVAVWWKRVLGGGRDALSWFWPRSLHQKFDDHDIHKYMAAISAEIDKDFDGE